jgi:uncharacterized protein
MKKMNPVVHFEMPAEDRKRMANFYSEVFGWEAEFYGEEMGNYVTVITSETDEYGMIRKPGSINGGFFPKSENMATRCPSLVIAVDDVKEHIKSVNESGGQVLGEPVNIPNVGLYVSFKDTEGNVCSILQPAMSREERIEVRETGGTGEI